MLGMILSMLVMGASGEERATLLEKISNPTGINNYIIYKVLDVLHIPSKTSMVALLKFGMDK